MEGRGNKCERELGSDGVSYALQKVERGLGLWNIELWNKASALKHLRQLLMRSWSLWGAWVNRYHLKGASIWVVMMPTDASWS